MIRHCLDAEPTSQTVGQSSARIGLISRMIVLIVAAHVSSAAAGAQRLKSGNYLLVPLQKRQVLHVIWTAGSDKIWHVKQYIASP